MALQFPENVRYTEDHEWVRQEGDLLVVGITDFAQKELGDIVYVEVETEGETLEAGDEFGSVEAVKTVSELFMPLAGEIVAFNETLEDEPSSINSDAYETGWVIKIKPANAADFEGLMDVTTYKALLNLD